MNNFFGITCRRIFALISLALFSVAAHAAPPGTLSLSSNAYAANQADGSVTITVNRSGTAGAVSVVYTTGNGSAAAGTDFGGTSGTLNWADGDATPKTFNVTLSRTTGFSGTKTFSVAIKNPTGGATLAAPSSATVTITGTPPQGSLIFSAANYPVNQSAGSVTVTVNRITGSQGAVSTIITTNNGATAITGVDFTGNSATLNWADGDSSPKTFTVQLNTSAAFSGTKVFNVSLLVPTGGVVIGSPGVADITITGTPVPGNLSLSASAYPVNQSAGSVTVTVNRKNGSQGAVSTVYTTGNGSAVAGTDYTATSGTLNWADGDSTPKTFKVTLGTAASFSGTKTFSVSLKSPTGGATLVGPASATVTITGTPLPGNLSLSASTYAVNQSAGSVTVTVTRTSGSQGAVSTVFTTANGSAIAGTDYGAKSGTLSWADGDSAPKTFTVTLGTAAAFSGTKTFSVILKSPSGGAALISPTSATVTITGTPLPGNLSLSSSSYAVNQSAGSVTISVKRTSGSTGAASTVYYTGNGTAVAGTDFAGTSGTLSWADGDATPKTFSVPISTAASFSGTKAFSVNLKTPTGSTLISPTTATVTITGTPLPGSLSLSSSSYAVNQSAGLVTITVKRLNNAEGAVSAVYTTGNGTAVAGTDFAGTSGTLNWADGDSTPKTFTVAISTAASFSGTKAFSVSLKNPTGGATLVTPTTATVTITGTPLPGDLSLSSSSYAVNQSAGSVTITVKRLNNAEGAVSTVYTTSNGSAAAGTDYTGTSGTLNWADGDSSPKTFTVKISTAASFSGTKTFSVSLKNPTGGATLVTPTTATVTITGTPLPGNLSLSSASYAVNQSAGSVTVTVNRTNGTQGAVSTVFTTSNGTASTGSDYTGNSGTLNWADGDSTPKTFTVLLSTASAFSGTKTFSVQLKDATGGAVLTTPTTATVTITGTPLPGNLGLSASSYTVNQSLGSVLITVQRTSGSTGAVSAVYTTANGTAIAGTDYTAASGTLNWSDGDSASKTFSVAISTANALSGSKSFSVLLKNPTGGAALASPTTATVTITSSPVAGNLSLSAASYAVNQSDGTVLITVNRSNGANGAVGTTFTTANGTASKGTDYTGNSGTLSWADGDTAPKTFSVAISTASAFSGTRSFSVILKDPTGDATLVTPTSATVTITGSDVSIGSVVSVDTASNLAPISSRQLGVNLSYRGGDVSDPAILRAVQAGGAQLVRWPGADADSYDWQNPASCPVADSVAGAGTANSFDAFMNSLVIPGGLEAAITVNYRADAACKGSGDPKTAAAWVAYAKSKGYNAHYWTVGSEEFRSSGNASAVLGSVYASKVAGANGFYALMKAADPSAQVGVVVEGAGWNSASGWDADVLSKAPFDYVELHWNAQQPGTESDSYLLTQAPQDFTSAVNTLRSELVRAGKPDTTPIMVGELSSVSSQPGKQTTSIVNALFLGMSFGEMLNDKLPVGALWSGAGGAEACGNNNSSSLYGWQNYGGLDTVAYDTRASWTSCGSGVKVPEATVFPNGRAAYLASQFATPGEHMLSVDLGSALTDVRAYAATQGSGYSLMLFNLSDSSTKSLSIKLSNASGSSYNASTITYGKQQYDDSANNVWTGPVKQSLGSVGKNVNLSLPPLSMTVVKLQ